jgi:hypothetical protein
LVTRKEGLSIVGSKPKSRDSTAVEVHEPIDGRGHEGAGFMPPGHVHGGLVKFNEGFNCEGVIFGKALEVVAKGSAKPLGGVGKACPVT